MVKGDSVLYDLAQLLKNGFFVRTMTPTSSFKFLDQFS
jgi:hypothetical protein